ncbi:hypothetical protein OCH239_12710 [Roseivivax halodurans JCM 10272]|uniref:Uncharacterized protein n=2 Tax=Roseivivax halodurans TaxID=93683 RepID=X7EDM7_9RHOB|nr:hypothetical protein OCH239_12710 [Roseivivax halodurans JCM 10272]
MAERSWRAGYPAVLVAGRRAARTESKRVELAAYVDDVDAWFARADVFVLLSPEEGGPQVVQEAAAQGLSADPRLSDG